MKIFIIIKRTLKRPFNKSGCTVPFTAQTTTFNNERMTSNDNFLVFSIDLEVELTQWKIGLEIFDLAIICSEDPKYNFESTKCIVPAEERLMTFKEYAPIMMQKIKDARDKIEHSKLIFLAHNGFGHGFLIIFDALERAGMLEQFCSEFKDAFYVDSLSFFRAYQRIHKGQFLSKGVSVSLGLESLCEHFCEHKYKAHTAAVDAESLIILMNHKPNGTGGTTFLQLNMHKDYEAHAKLYKEVLSLFEAKKKVELIRHSPGYGARYKQLEVELSNENIANDTVHALVDSGYDYFKLKNIGVKTKKEISEELIKFCPVKAQLNRLAEWCRKVAGAEKDDSTKTEENGIKVEALKTKNNSTKIEENGIKVETFLNKILEEGMKDKEK